MVTITPEGLAKKENVQCVHQLSSRVLRDSISHFVGPPVGPSVRNKVVFKAFYRFFDGSEWRREEKKLGGVKSLIKSAFEKNKFCPSVCLTFFESAEARDLGLMTLFYLHRCTISSSNSARRTVQCLNSHFLIL